MAPQITPVYRNSCAMLLVWWLACVVGIAVYHVEAGVTAEICQVKPQEKHCLIEWMVRDRWPHQERWVFDWRRRNCHIIRWADHCPPPQPDTNNFASEAECMDECSGWA